MASSAGFFCTNTPTLHSRYASVALRALFHGASPCKNRDQKTLPKKICKISSTPGTLQELSIFKNLEPMSGQKSFFCYILLLMLAYIVK